MIGLTIVASLEAICGVLSDGAFVGSHSGAFPRDLLVEKTDELLLLHDDVLDKSGFEGLWEETTLTHIDVLS